MSDEFLIGIGAYAVIGVVLIIITLILLISIPINLSKLKELQKENNLLVQKNDELLLEIISEIIRLQDLTSDKTQNKNSA